MEFLLIVVLGILLLQYFLSIHDNQLLGWILPILALIFAFVYTFYINKTSEQHWMLNLTFSLAPALVLTCIRFASKDLDKLTNRKR